MLFKTFNYCVHNSLFQILLQFNVRVNNKFIVAFLLFVIHFELTTVCIVAASTSTSIKHHHHKRFQDQYDSILIARCMAKCRDKRPNTLCVKSCVVTPLKKFGDCPIAETLSVFDTACLSICTFDSECPDIAKCCKHTCGITCQRPKYLQKVPGLPPIPTNLTVTEKRRSKGVTLKWNGLKAKTSGLTILYVIEERHYAGHHFIESRLGPWTVRHHTGKTSATLRNVVKPGRWYQFRIAAVNENGTQGYSEPSKQFTTQYGPRPPGPPNNLAMGALWSNDDGTMSGELRWSTPISDLPILRYKVFWSRRLQGATSVLDSVLVNHQTVPKEQTTFILKQLQPGFQYFLQVQALAQYGRNRLKGEKAAIILNTTNHTNSSFTNTSIKLLDKKSNVRIHSLTVHKIYWSRKKLLARILWKPPPGIKKNLLKYTISWWIRECYGSEQDYSTNLQQAVTTQNTRFDIYDLKSNCKYRVSVHVVSEGLLMSQESAINFVTPNCENFRSKTEKDSSKCV